MADINKASRVRKVYDWGLHLRAENFLNKRINEFLKNNKFAHRLAVQLEKTASTRFFDWVDHVVLPSDRVKEIRELGFQEVREAEAQDDTRVFIHPDAVFFPVLSSNNALTEAALKPERLDHFMQTMGRDLPIEGGIHAPYRRAVIYAKGNYVLSAVERRGYNGFLVVEAGDAETYREAMEAFLTRQRYFDTSREGLKSTQRLVKGFIGKLTLGRVTDAFFRAERFYWERRNRIAQLQRSRQDKHGLGWGNHDHHTYRSSRSNFPRLVRLLEAMGFVPREQFFAGEKAGWGAQILEHQVCNIVVFADVDISTKEKDEDFAHGRMENRGTLGTIGLWVALHGESILQAGLHHLAARYDFERLRADLKKLNANVMAPFSNFDFLRQAFTEPQHWGVEKYSLTYLLQKGFINERQYEVFMKGGAVGSHLENIQRAQGFKGFNQDSVSAIIKATDPREQRATGA